MSATVSPAGLAQRHRDGAPFDLVDVSTPGEFHALHVQFARNIPLDKIDPQALLSELQASPGKQLYFICQSGARSEIAWDLLSAAGASQIASVAGGTQACDQAGLPLVRGKGTISLERQVRIAAGSLVLTGLILAWQVHWAFIGLTAFVGAGLVFAGITNTCGMGMLLARMPWNRAPKEAPTACSLPKTCSITNRPVQAQQLADH